MSTSPRVGVLVVAYNAATTLAATLNRLPEVFADTVEHILICDDASSDDTYEVGRQVQSNSRLPITLVRHPENLGYGGNQKHGYRWAIEQELDIVVLLHGDGQYAPESITDLVEPLVRGEADAVFGSRMMHRGQARAGGMPLYKYLGNRILTGFQNRVAGLELSEWHSGYRAYRVDVLSELDLASYSDDFDFDTEIILGLHAMGAALAEVPIPTYYGDEICYVNGIKYAKDVTLDTLRYRLRSTGLGAAARSEEGPYAVKPSPRSSHGVLLEWLGASPAARVLDVGCSDGTFADLVRAQGHWVAGVDLVKHEGVAERVDHFVEADLNQGLPSEAGHDYDFIVAGDVLEHVIAPEKLLRDLVRRLAPDGQILVSIPNFAHWYPRARVAVGRFDYDQRGLLDHGHLRFFTRRSFEKLVHDEGLSIVAHDTVGSPIDIVRNEQMSERSARTVDLIERVDQAATRTAPTLFGYQFLYRLAPPRWI